MTNNIFLLCNIKKASVVCSSLLQILLNSFYFKYIGLVLISKINFVHLKILTRTIYLFVYFPNFAYNKYVKQTPSVTKFSLPAEWQRTTSADYVVNVR